MAELGSKGVTAGKIASNVQKKLTRAQEKVKGGGSAVARCCGVGLGFPEPFAVLQPPALSAAGGNLCWPPRRAGVPERCRGEGRAQPPGPNAVLLLPPGNWAGLLGLGMCSGRFLKCRGRGAAPAAAPCLPCSSSRGCGCRG